jgi:Glycosyl transferase family 90
MREANGDAMGDRSSIRLARRIIRVISRIPAWYRRLWDEQNLPLSVRRVIAARRSIRFCQSCLNDPVAKFAIILRRYELEKPLMVAIDRERRRIKVRGIELMFGHGRNVLFSRLCALLPVVVGAPLDYLRLVAEISDGEDSSPGLVSFCSRHPGAVLIPDEFFVHSRGYENLRRIAQLNRTVWSERSDRILWRGTSSGFETISKQALSIDDHELIARVRFCLTLKDTPGIDVKLCNVLPSHDRALHEERFAKAGIFGEYVPPLAWCGHKFAIDIDGNTNAFSNFFTRLLMGCCVLKIASPAGYRQWYYGEIEPWTHYVPVKADFSDVLEKIAWCRANPDQCGQIAARGQAFAMARDFDSEMASAIRRVCEAYENGKLHHATFRKL